MCHYLVFRKVGDPLEVLSREVDRRSLGEKEKPFRWSEGLQYIDHAYVKLGSDLSAFCRNRRWNWHLFHRSGEVVKASSGHNPKPFWIRIPKNCYKIRCTKGYHPKIFFRGRFRRPGKLGMGLPFVEYLWVYVSNTAATCRMPSKYWAQGCTT